MPLGQWSSFLRSPYFFQLLIQIDRTSLFCTTDALASDMNRYLFARSFTSLSLWDLSCSFSFSFSFSSFSYSSYTSKERFSSQQRRSNSFYVQKSWTNEEDKNIKSTASEISGGAHPFNFSCSTFFNVNFVQLIYLIKQIFK